MSAYEAVGLGAGPETGGGAKGGVFGDEEDVLGQFNLGYAALGGGLDGAGAQSGSVPYAESNAYVNDPAFGLRLF